MADESRSIRDAVQLMTRYNMWANEQFATYFSELEDDVLTHFVANSFPSLEGTLLHIWDSQDIWYRRVHGESPAQQRSKNWSGTPQELFEGLRSSSGKFVRLADASDAQALGRVIQYTTFRYGDQSSRLYEILLHVCNHSMYHRGQCITMARALDLENLPSTDLIRYLRLDGIRA